MAITNVGILSLGCPRNLVDSEVLLGRIYSKKYRVVDIKDAEIAIINTCAFIEEAKNESIDAILELIELKKEGSLKKIIVAGCLSQRYGKDLLNNFKGEIDAIVGTIGVGPSDSAPYKLTPRHFSYLKISEGCGNFCSYCIIPYIKGNLTSREKDSLLKEIKELDKSGVKELNIVGQDITLYGADTRGRKRVSLTELLEDIVGSVSNIEWIRLLYMNPERIDDKLIDLIASEDKICNYVDMPLQHINTRILKLMNRNINKEYILNLIKKLRERIKNVALRTSFIVGFPSETEAEFSELIEFMKAIKFERLGAFMYSREEGTPAYGFPNQIHAKVKQKRYKELMTVQQDIAEGINKEFLGKVLDVIIDEYEDNSDKLYIGRSRFDAPEVDGTVYVQTDKRLKKGDIVKALVIDTLEYDLVARV